MNFVSGLLVGRSLANSANEILERQHDAEISKAKTVIDEKDRSIASLRAQNADLRNQNMNLKANIEGYRDIRRRLHDALNQVAPGHNLADWEEQRRIINNTADEEFNRMNRGE